MQIHYSIFREFSLKTISLVVLLLAISNIVLSQINIDKNKTANQLATELGGDGVKITNVTINCPNGGSASFSNGATSNIGFDKGILLVTGNDADIVKGPNNSGSDGTNGNNPVTDPDLATITTGSLQDACIIEFDFQPACDKINMSYVFASEEYPEYVCSTFNDVFGFFVTGPNPLGGNYNKRNIAVVPTTNIGVAINSINSGAAGTNALGGVCNGLGQSLAYSSYYVNNLGGTSIEFDGFTKPLVAELAVVPCAIYHLKLAISDVGDPNFDSGVFLQTDGLRCPVSFDVQPSNTICAGQSVTIVATGPVTDYVWGPASSLNTTTGTTVIASPTVTTTYTVTNSCGLLIDSVTVYVAGPSIGGVPISDLSCSNSNDGYIIKWGQDGVGPYTYNWSSPLTGGDNSQFNLPPGTYTLTITDSKGCTVTDSYTINSPPPLVVDLISSTPASCGVDNGTIDISASGGSGIGIEYAVVWGTWQASGNFTGLAAGEYQVFVKDSKDCWIATTITVPSSSGLDGNLDSKKDNTCFGQLLGEATVTATGGAGGYTYSIDNGGTFVGSGAFTGLAAGNYNIVIKDASGCEVIQAVTINEPDNLDMNVFKTDPTCGLPNGGFNLGGFFGTPNYTYSKDGGTNYQASGNFNGLIASTYTLVVKDAAGCTSTKVEVLANSGALGIQLNSKVDNICNGFGTGSIDVIGTGSTGYTYSIDGITFQPTGVFSSLTAQQYTVTVKDDNNCTFSSTVNITEPNAISLSITTTPENCGVGGSVTATNVLGGTGAYEYSIDGNTFQVSNSFTNKIAGSYTVTVKDANGCFGVAASTVTAVNSPTIVLDSKIDIKCSGAATGEINVSATGTSGYTYSIDGGVFGAASSFTGLIAKQYTLTVKDGNGCTNTTTVTLGQPATPLSMQTGPINAKCFGACDGIATVIPAGGSGSYNFTWSTSPSNSASIQGLCKGNYAVTVSDANACTVTSVIPIDEPLAFTVSGTATAANCNQADGGITLTPVGGVGTLSYVWSSVGVTGASPNTLAAGNYCVTVTDGATCTATTCTIVNNNSPGTLSITSANNISCNAGTDGAITALATGFSGTVTYTWNTLPIQSTTSISTLKAGNYCLTINDQNLCTAVICTTLTEPPVILATPTIPAAVCQGQSITLTASATGGSCTNYSYTWLPSGNTGSTLTLSPTTSNTVSLVASCGTCPSAPQAIPIDVRPPLNIVALPNPDICPGQSASASVTASGGKSSTYTITWLPGGATGLTQNLSPTTTTTYTIILTDGCTVKADTAFTTLSVAPVPTVDLTADITSGCPQLCVNFADASVLSSGTITDWNWTFGDGGTGSGATPVHCFVASGIYTVKLDVVTDKGCTATATKTDMINVFDVPTAAFTYSPLQPTITTPTVDFIDASSGATTWNWTFSDVLDNSSILKNPQHTFGDTGTYRIRLLVQNADGCIDSTDAFITVIPEFTFFIPNAFSPNGDNLNEKFGGMGSYIKSYQLLIFDRWGAVIFKSDDITKQWDGKANNGNEMAHQDVYVYQIIVEDTFKKKHTYTGHVTLVR